MKKLLSIILSAIMICSMNVTSLASELTDEEPQYPMIEVELDYDNAVENADGTVTYEILNLEELASALGINASDIKAAKYVGISHSEDVYPSPRENISIENIDGPRSVCGLNAVARSEAVNRLDKPIKKIITLTGTVSNKYSLW